MTAYIELRIPSGTFGEQAALRFVVIGMCVIRGIAARDEWLANGPERRSADERVHDGHVGRDEGVGSRESAWFVDRKGRTKQSRRFGSERSLSSVLSFRGMIRGQVRVGRRSTALKRLMQCT